MPKLVTTTKAFLEICGRKDARFLKVLKGKLASGAKKAGPTKLKVRCSKFLYTYVVEDKKKADRILKAMSSNLKHITVTGKTNGGARKVAASATKKKKQN